MLLTLAKPEEWVSLGALHPCQHNVVELFSLPPMGLKWIVLSVLLRFPYIHVVALWRMAQRWKNWNSLPLLLPYLTEQHGYHKNSVFPNFICHGFVNAFWSTMKSADSHGPSYSLHCYPAANICLPVSLYTIFRMSLFLCGYKEIQTGYRHLRRIGTYKSSTSKVVVFFYKWLFLQVILLFLIGLSCATRVDVSISSVISNSLFIRHNF